MVGQRQNCPDSERQMPGGTRQIQADYLPQYVIQTADRRTSDLSEPTHCWKGGAPRGAKSAKKETERMPRCTCDQQGGSSQSNESSKRNLSMAGVDYKKAFDMVPHRWIGHLLKAIRAP